MTVKRTPDPLGILPDHIHIDFDGKEPIDEMKAIEELFNRESIMARIARLHRHKQLAAIADELYELAISRYGNAIPLNGDWELRARVAEAELAALYFGAEELPDRTYRQRQKVNAERSRPGRSSPQRKAVINAMSGARKNDMSLRDFLDALKIGSVDGIRAEEYLDQYEIDFTDPSIDGQTVPYKTLEDWWGNARPSK